MIIARTPFRISFTGGGSDLRPYYGIRPGAVVSVALNRYVHVTVSKRFDDTVRVAYTRTEIVASADDVQHDLVREAMRLTGVLNGVEITTVADVPAGTGLGSSSSLTVGLLQALYARKGRYRSPEQLARDACHIEMEVLNRPIGKQDQYAAAYGGLNYMRFNSDESVFVQPILCKAETRRALEHRSLMFYISARRDDSRVLFEQHQRTIEDVNARAILDAMVDVAGQTRDSLQDGDLDAFGELLHSNWLLKCQLNPGVTSPSIDEWYTAARSAGAIGGKILGAGGSGFLFLFCAEGSQERVRGEMEKRGLRYFGAGFDPEGSKLFLIGDGAE